MKLIKAYKFRIKPSSNQLVKLRQFTGCCRFVWNKVLKISLNKLENKQKIIWYNEASSWLPKWKELEEYKFLGDSHSQILQQKLMDLDKAFKDAFDKKQPLKRIPKFRKKGVHDSFRYPQNSNKKGTKSIRIDNRRVLLPKVGWMKFFKSRNILGAIKNLTIKRNGKYWYCSIQTELEVMEPKTKATREIGIDLGINRFAVTSDNKCIDYPKNVFKKFEIKIAKEQKKLSKKKRFSSNFNKQKKRIQRIYSKITNIRFDFLHKQSTILSKNHALIVVEDLKIKNMSKSAKGNIEKPGKNVKAKSGLNKSILNQGWGIFKDLLKYKLKWNGGKYLKVPPPYTSQKCSKCNYISKDNRKVQKKFQCLECGHKENADFNAAKNILMAGHAFIACGE
jgi:putative transposase